MLSNLNVRNFKSLDNALMRPSITDFFAKEKGWNYRLPSLLARTTVP